MATIFKNIKATGTLNVAGTSTLADVSVSGTATMTNLIVTGTTTSINTTNVNVKDNYLYLNSGYTTASGKAGGFAVNYLPTSTADVSALTAFVAPATLTTSDAVAFAANDIIQVSGSAGGLNDGIYVVASYAVVSAGVEGTITIKTTAANLPFSTAFVNDSTAGASVTKINAGILRVGSAGLLQYATGATDSLTFGDVVTDSSVFALLAGRPGGQTLNGGSATTQSLSLRGNAADLTTGGVAVLTTKDATNTTTAALTVAGGLGVVKKSFFGDAVDVTGSATASVSFLAPALDTATGVTLAVGGTTATALDLGRTAITSSVLGKLQVNGRTQFDDNLIETVTALSGASITSGFKAFNTLSHTATFAVTLPAGVAGTIYRFLNIANFTCTLSGNGGETIEGGTLDLTLNDTVHLMFMGGVWRIVG